VAFEDETIITQKPCIRKSLSFEGEQQKIEHTGSREKFSAYISMVWPEEKLMYNFYDEMNSTNTIDHLENLKSYTMKNGLWKRLILIWDNASFHLSKMVMDYINTQKEEDWLNIIYLPKKAPYLNPNERKVNQQIKSNICANRFYDHIEEQKVQCQNIWTKDLENGMTTLVMTLDLEHLKNPDPDVLKKLKRDSNRHSFITENGDLYQIEIDALQKDPERFKELVLSAVDRYFDQRVYGDVMAEFTPKDIDKLVHDQVQFSESEEEDEEDEDLDCLT